MDRAVELNVQHGGVESKYPDVWHQRILSTFLPFPNPWSQIVDMDGKNEITHTNGWVEFPSYVCCSLPYRWGGKVSHQRETQNRVAVPLTMRGGSGTWWGCLLDRHVKPWGRPESDTENAREIILLGYPVNTLVFSWKSWKRWLEKGKPGPLC